MMKVGEFEEAVWRIDGIRIVIRAAADCQVRDYDYQIAAKKNWRITQLLGRIKEYVGDLEVVVIQGNGEQPNGGRHLETIRNSYQH